MVGINVKSKEKTIGGWRLILALEEENEPTLEFNVEVDEDHYVELTNLSITPEDLVKRSFQYLLNREGKHEIIQSFNLRDISKYFPEFEDMVRLK